VIRFVTSNEGKFVEVQRMMQFEGLQVEQFNYAYPEIQTGSLEAVLGYAAPFLDEALKGDYMADDSGIFISALQGFPGVYSAYANDTLRCEGILRLMEGVRDRTAEFQTVVLVSINADKHYFKSSCRGTIAEKKRGRHGFGYDPIFIPQGHKRTFAQMSLDEKNAVSHRGRAFREVIRYLRSRRLA